MVRNKTIKRITDLKLGFYKVQYGGKWQLAELVEREYLKEPVFLINADLIPHELLDSNTVIPIKQ